MREQRRLDLTKFDADSSDLDLIITTSQKFNLPIGKKSGPVPRVIHSCSVGTGKRIFQEFFRSQLHSIEVTARHLLTAEIEFPNISGGHGLQIPVKNVGRDITDSAPDGGQPDSLRSDDGEGAPNSILRWTIAVDHLEAMMRLRTTTERVTAGNHETQSQVNRPRTLHEQWHQGRRHEGDGRLLPINPGNDAVHLKPVKEIVWRDQHRGPRGQCRPEIAHGDVESHVCRQGDPIQRGHPEAVVINTNQIA